MSKFVASMLMFGLCLCAGRGLFADCGCGCESKVKKEEMPKCEVMQPKEECGVTGATGAAPSSNEEKPENTDTKY